MSNQNEQTQRPGKQRTGSGARDERQERDGKKNRDDERSQNRPAKDADKQQPANAPRRS